MAFKFNPFTASFDIVTNIAKQIWDIGITNTVPINGQVLAYNSDTNEWEPQNQLEFSSGFAEVENTYVAKIANNGTVASIIEQKGGFIDSVTRTGAGLVTINFTSGFFSVAPIARFETPNNTGVEVHEADLDAPTTVNNAYVYTRTALSYTAIDVDFEIVVHRSGADRNEPTIYYDATLDIDGRFETTTTDTTNDYLLIYDASVGENRKVTPDNLGLATPPAGSNGEIQFNDNGSFGADSNLYWDNTNKRLSIDNASPTSDLHVGNGTDSQDRSIQVQRNAGIYWQAYLGTSFVEQRYTRSMVFSGLGPNRNLYYRPSNTYMGIMTATQIAWFTASVVKANTRYYIKGSGTSTDYTFRVANSAESDIFYVQDNKQATFGGAIRKPIATISTDATLDESHYTVLVDCSSGAVNVTLPSSVDGRIYNIKKIDSTANQVTFTGTIDGGSVNLTTQYESISIQNSTTNWWVL